MGWNLNHHSTNHIAEHRRQERSRGALHANETELRRITAGWSVQHFRPIPRPVTNLPTYCVIRTNCGFKAQGLDKLVLGHARGTFWYIAIRAFRFRIDDSRFIPEFSDDVPSFLSREYSRTSAPKRKRVEAFEQCSLPVEEICRPCLLVFECMDR